MGGIVKTWFGRPHRALRAGVHRNPDLPAGADIRRIEARTYRFETPVVGVTYHQDMLKTILADAPLAHPDEREVRALLIPEPENRRDPSAVMVCAAPSWDIVGYLPHRTGSLVQRNLLAMLAAQHAVASCTVRIRSGSRSGTISASLDVDIDALISYNPPPAQAGRAGGDSPKST
jgi:hypothetical protein